MPYYGGSTVQSLRSSLYFSVLADECQDILHVKDVDAAAITQALTFFMEEKNPRLVGQGYGGAATFSGCTNGVQRRIRTHSAHALCIHCACHRIQLASNLDADSITVINKMFGTMMNLWRLFYYLPRMQKL